MIKRCVMMACLLAGLFVTTASPGFANEWRGHGGEARGWHDHGWRDHGWRGREWHEHGRWEHRYR